MHKPRTIHGIDPYAPGGLDALFAHHRAVFGDAVMEAEGETPPAGGETPPAGAGETPPASETPPAGDTKPPADNPWADPEKAKAEIERLRAENGKERTNAKTKAAEDARNELVKELGKALGFVKDGDAKPDPEALTKQISTLSTEATQAKTELAVYKAASKAGADADALLDSRGFLAKLTDIDPTDTKAITKAIEDAVKDNPKLRLVQAAGQSGADFTGGSGDGAKSNATPGIGRLRAAYGG